MEIRIGWLVGVLTAVGMGGGAAQVLENRWAAEPGEGVEISKETTMLLEERKDMDQLLWRGEVEALDCEEVINTLWGLLRSAPREDRVEVFSQVPFETIKVGGMGKARTLENGVVVTGSTRGTGVAMTALEWIEVVAGFVEEGYLVEGSEWRHVNFIPQLPDQGARSVVEYEITGSRGKTTTGRAVLRGTLHIDWDSELGDDGRPRMKSIDATEFTLTEREGESWYEDPLTFEPAAVWPGVDAMMVPVLVRDLDRDGLPEVILGGQNVLLRNKGSFQFVREPLFVDADRRLSAGVVEDFDGDGWMDVIGVDKEGAAWLLRGRDGGRFAKVAERAWEGVAPAGGAMTAGDVDGDGDLDLWFAPYKAPYVDGRMAVPYYDANDGFASTLWINDGSGGFTDGTEAAGLAEKRTRRTRSASFVDLDRDDDLDLVVVSDFAGLDVYGNLGDGTFMDTRDGQFEGRSGFGMGHAFGDFDGNGRTDLYMTGRSDVVARRLNGMGLKRNEFLEHNLRRKAMSFGNRLYQSQGELFLQSNLNDGCAEAGWSWGAAAFDLENDGDEEIYVATGHLSGLSATDYASYFWRHDIYTKAGAADEGWLMTDQFRTERMRGLDDGLISWGGHQRNRLYVNHHGREFEESAYLFGVGHEADCRSVVAADIDADGRQDLLVVEQARDYTEGPALRQVVKVHRNVVPQKNHWVGVRLRGRAGGTVQGARVVVHGKFGRKERVVVTGDSFLAQHPAVVSFGLGEVDSISKVEVIWPGGKRTEQTGVAVDGYVLMRPPKGE